MSPFEDELNPDPETPETELPDDGSYPPYSIDQYNDRELEKPIQYEKNQIYKPMVGQGYSPSYTDTRQGTGYFKYNIPNVGGGGYPQRHAAAWEQVCPAFHLVADCFDTPCPICGARCPEIAEAIRKLANESFMPFLRSK